MKHMSNNHTAAIAAAPPGQGQSGLIAKLVYVFEQVMPDPFVLSIGLTALVAILAFAFAPHASVPDVLNAWYGGAFKILAFALQMILILATGFAVADAPVVRRGLRRLAENVQTPAQAVLLLFPVVAAAAWLNWGLGLVVAAFLSREIARQTRVDFAWLVAGSYSAWSICNNGLSSSIALSQASHGSALNFVEKATGHVIPLSGTIFAPFVLVPTSLVIVIMAAIFIKMHPKDGAIQAFAEPAATPRVDPHARAAGASSLASRMERSFVGVVLLFAFGGGLLAMTWYEKGFSLDINTTILIFLLVGLVLQGTPIAYANAIRDAAKQTGSMLLQYPLYGGIMGIMAGTGLAAVIAKGFVGIATAATLPLWSFVSSLIITLLVPSAGGHWAIQGRSCCRRRWPSTPRPRGQRWAWPWPRTCRTCSSPSGPCRWWQWPASGCSASWATQPSPSSCHSSSTRPHWF
jgi:short-chain fatty acids transporter